MFKNKKVRNWLFAVIAVVAIAVVAFQMLSPVNATASTAVAQGKVVALEVTQTIEASGSLEAQPFAALTWNTGGAVQDVNVEPGDQVQAGDVLMTLQTLSVSSNIISAQADLVNTQKELDDLLNSDAALAQAAQDLANAKQAVEDAQKDVTKLDYRRASDDLLDQTRAEIDLANKQVSFAEDAYKRVKNRPDGDSLKAQALLNLTNARLERDNKQATLDWYLGKPSELDAEKYRAALAVAQAQEEDAQREYDRLSAGNIAEITATQARIDAAQATVNSLYIIAPFNGQVLSVESQKGDSVHTGDLAINIADMKHLYVESQIDESDVANVKVGQQVDVTLDALSGVALTGKVAAINPVGEMVSGLVKYTVRIDLNPITDQAFIPLGTTANVTIHISDAQSSLAVPITAIQNDSEGEYVLVIQADGSTERVDIVSGDIVRDLVVVAGNLKEGDLVSTESASQTLPGPFGGD